MKGGLACSGTEPFWSLSIDPSAAQGVLTTPEDMGGEKMDIVGFWPGQSWHPVAAVELSDATAVIQAKACSDGMSDQVFGLSLDLFRRDGAGNPSSSLEGCCRLAP